MCQDYVHIKTGHENSEGEYMYSSILSLSKAIYGGGRGTQCLGRFTPANVTTPIVLEGEGPRVGLDGCKNLALRRNLIPRPPNT